MFKFLLVFSGGQVKNWRFRARLWWYVRVAYDKVFAGRGCFLHRYSVCLIYIFDYLRAWKNFAAKTLTRPTERGLPLFESLLAFFKFVIGSVKSDELSRHVPIFEQECNGSFFFQTSARLATLFDWRSDSETTWNSCIEWVLRLIEGHLTAVFKKIDIVLNATWEKCFSRLTQLLASERYCRAWVFKGEHILLLLFSFRRKFPYFGQMELLFVFGLEDRLHELKLRVWKLFG